MLKSKVEVAHNASGGEPNSSVTIETTERDNLRKLAKAVPEDFVLGKVTTKLERARKLQKRHARKSRSHLHIGLMLAYTIALAATKLAKVKQAVFTVCDKKKITFKGSTSIVLRSVRAHLTDDPARASDYSMAIRGAIVAGFAPDTMLEKLKAGEETLGSLAARLKETNATPSPKSIRVVLTSGARKRFYGLERPRKLLAVVVADPTKVQIKVRLLTAQTKRAIERFAKPKADKLKVNEMPKSNSNW
jgi:hypothetical protein